MPDYLALADIVVMPSAFEQQARLYLETQASGRLLAASDIPGVRDVAQHGCTGLLYPVADVEALTRTLLLAAHDPDLRGRIGRAARRRVEAHSLPVVARMAETLLVDVLARARG
jgi:glycosyltransferase involved in cell wall biosynthesis